VLKLELEARGEKRGKHVASMWEKEKDLAESGLLVSVAAPDGSASEYGDQFRAFSRWIVGSLDAYKEELGQLLYPTFVYTYVTMVQLEADTAAQDLLAESKDLFLSQTTNSGRREILLKEIHEFSKMTSPEDFEEFENDVLKQRVSLTMSSYVYELMMQYLRQERLVLVASLLNRWFSISVVQDFDPDTMLGFWSATANVDSTAGTQQHAAKVSAELLKDSPYLKFQEIVLKQKIQRSEESLGGIEEDTKEHKEATRKVDAMRAQLAKFSDKGLRRADSAVPLPKRSDLLENFEDMEEYVGKWLDSSPAPPPCALATVLNSHDSLNAVAVSSDFKTLVGGFADSAIRLYNLEDGNKATCLCGHTGPVYAVDSWTGGGRDTSGGTYESNPLILSGSGDGTVRLWSAELEANVSYYQGHVLPVWDVSFCQSSYGHYFASGGADKTCRMWDTGRKTCLRVFAGHSSDVEVVKWHPNCQILASGGADGCVRLWDVASGGCVSVLSPAGNKAPITSMEFLVRNNQCGELLVGDELGRLTRWDLRASGGSVSGGKISAGPVWSIGAANYRGDMYCSGGDDGCVRVFVCEEAEFVEKHVWGTKATPVSWCGFGNFDSFIFGVGALCA
jgi:transcription initiation factor TFIID subunit 5